MSNAYQQPSVTASQQLESLHTRVGNDRGHFSMDRVTKIRDLGKGSFAKVVLCEDNVTHKQMAVKMIRRSNIQGRREIASIENEISFLYDINHVNVIRLFDFGYNDKYVLLALEYCANGDLGKFIDQFKSKRLSEEGAQYFFKQLVRGLSALFEKNCLHRDLKPSNLLLNREKDNKLILKLADFGFAHSNQWDMDQTHCGTPLYMAPEVLDACQHYDQKADLWSAGVILYEMVVGRKPYQGASIVEQTRLVQHPPTIPPEVEAKLSRECVDLIRLLLRANPAERIGIGELRRHPFLHLHLDPHGGLRASSQQALSVTPLPPATSSPLGGNGPLPAEASGGTFFALSAGARSAVGLHVPTSLLTSVIQGAGALPSPLPTPPPPRDMESSPYEGAPNPGPAVAVGSAPISVPLHTPTLAIPSPLVSPRGIARTPLGSSSALPSCPSACPACCLHGGSLPAHCLRSHADRDPVAPQWQLLVRDLAALPTPDAVQGPVRGYPTPAGTPGLLQPPAPRGPGSVVPIFVGPPPQPNTTSPVGGSALSRSPQRPPIALLRESGPKLGISPRAALPPLPPPPAPHHGYPRAEGGLPSSLHSTSPTRAAHPHPGPFAAGVSPTPPLSSSTSPKTHAPLGAPSPPYPATPASTPSVPSTPGLLDSSRSPTPEGSLGFRSTSPLGSSTVSRLPPLPQVPMAVPLPLPLPLPLPAERSLGTSPISHPGQMIGGGASCAGGVQAASPRTAAVQQRVRHLVGVLSQCPYHSPAAQAEAVMCFFDQLQQAGRLLDSLALVPLLPVFFAETLDRGLLAAARPLLARAGLPSGIALVLVEARLRLREGVQAEEARDTERARLAYRQSVLLLLYLSDRVRGCDLVTYIDMAELEFVLANLGARIDSLPLE
ncbi:putative Serine/Threonine protein kinases family protein [Paratrimastix pyriformis]|uniref:Serine/Threonine protein kinases family protein n=1 Tax=Paratrimastix pyriformis TaxID=342808 RepID=A0ABQ8UQF0_9EUKA|nr:putative Serine/Threonine protein kinases family protein [Paratrimastix pyriformis]